MAGKLILKGAQSGSVEFTAPDSGANTTINAGLLVFKDSENGSIDATSTDNISEGSNLYYTTARFDSDFATKDLHDSVAVQAQIDSTIASTDTHDSVAVQGQFDSALPVALASDVSLGNITTTGYIRGPATFTLDPAAHDDSTGTLRVLGNLTVEGTTTTINSTTVETSDLALALAKDAIDSAACDGAGITVASATASFTYDHSNTRWDANKDLSFGDPNDVASTLSTDATILVLSADPSDASANSGIQFRVDNVISMQLHDNTTSYDMSLDNGNLGLGTTTPQTPVHIRNSDSDMIRWQGSFASGASNTRGEISYFDGSQKVAGNHLYYDGTAVNMVWGSFYNGGYQTSSVMELQADGDLHVDGDVIAYSTTTSDIRLKDNVKTIENGLDKVCALRGVSYTWNSGSREGQQEIGVIAQEVEEVFPEIVREKKHVLVDGETYKTVDYDKLVGVLIEAVKELKAEIDELKGNQ